MLVLCEFNVHLPLFSENMFYRLGRIRLGELVPLAAELHSTTRFVYHNASQSETARVYSIPYVRFTWLGSCTKRGEGFNNKKKIEFAVLQSYIFEKLFH